MSKCDLLVVDDEPDMANGLRRILESRGYRVDVAHSGPEAVAMAQECAPAGLIMDIHMPQMNGIEAYRLIEADCPESFVIFMTAYSDLIDSARSLAPKKILDKPLDLDELLPLLPSAHGKE